MKKYTFLFFLIFPLLAFSQKKERIYLNSSVEKPAEFRGGQAELMEWLTKIRKTTVLLPNEPKPHRITFKLTIEKDGRVSNVENIFHQLNKNDELYRKAMYKMPQWKPATIRNRRVRSKISIVMGCSGVTED